MSRTNGFSVIGWNCTAVSTSYFFDAAQIACANGGNPAASRRRSTCFGSSVVDANVQRELVRGLTGFVSVENIAHKQYQVNLSGAGANTLISFGLPRTVRIGLQAYRY